MDTRQLQQSMLFRGMTELEITKALQVLEAHEKSFQKGETLLIAGTITERMGLVLEGSVTIESNDAWATARSSVTSDRVRYSRRPTRCWKMNPCWWT